VERAYLELSRYGRVETVALGGRFTVGRADDNDLALLTDSMVSQRHAILERVSTGWQVRDLNSRNGTYVNDTQVERSQPLNSRDEITVGGTRLVFWLEPAPESGSAGTSAIPPQVSAAGPTGPQPVSSLAQAPGDSGYLEVSDEWGDLGQVPSATPAADRPPAGNSAVKPVPPPSTGLSAPAPSVPAPEDRMDRRRGRFRGIARNVHRQDVPNEGAILTFRVERYDRSGNRMPPVSVEFRRIRRGVVSDGDEVDVAGKWSKGTLKASTITNISTNSQVLGPHGAEKVGLTCGLIFIICFFLFVIGGIIVGILAG